MAMVLIRGNSGLGLAISFIVFFLFFNCFWVFLFIEEYKKWLKTQHLIIEFSEWAASNRTLYYDLTETQRLRQMLAAQQQEATLMNEDLLQKHQMISQQKVNQFEQLRKQNPFLYMDLFDDEDQNPEVDQNLGDDEEHDLALHQEIERWQQQPQQLQQWKQQWQQVLEEESPDEWLDSNIKISQIQQNSDIEENPFANLDIFDDQNLSDGGKSSEDINEQKELTKRLYQNQRQRYDVEEPKEETSDEWFDANYWNPNIERLI